MVIPFPLAKRRSLVLKCAAYMAQLRPEKAAEHVERTAETQRETMARRGIPADVIEAEVRRFYAAVEQELCRINFAPHGAA